jgi:hypothetical protein
VRSDLEPIVNRINKFSDWPHVEKIKFFAWFLHSVKKRERFAPADIRACYDAIDSEKPTDVNPYIHALEHKKPKELLRDSKRELYLAKPIRDALEAKYGHREITVQVTKLLLELPEKLPDLSERIFLEETLTCYRHGAFRAAVVMAWNLAYHHLCDYVLKNKLSNFNTRWPLVYPGHHKKRKQTYCIDGRFYRGAKGLRNGRNLQLSRHHYQRS